MRETPLSSAPALPPLPKGPRFQIKDFLCSAIFIQFLGWGGMPPFPGCCPSHPRVLLGSVSSFGGRFWCPEAWSGGKARQLVPSWGCWSPLLERRRVGRGTACQNSELHYIPSWGCRVVGGRGVPQPQHPESLRDQVSRVSPEKELRARAPGKGNDRAQG